MWRLVLSCYPAAGSAHFDRIATAAIACYVARRHAEDLDLAEHRARQELAANGWVTSGVLERELVDLSSVDDVRDFYERAEQAGLTFNVYQVPRKHLPGHPSPGALQRLFGEVVAQLAAGGFTYVGGRGEQAIGELEEQPFFPLWPTADAAASCEDEWTPCSIAAIQDDQLITYLEEQDEAERMCALWLPDSSMVFFNTLALCDALRTQLGKNPDSL